MSGERNTPTDEGVAPSASAPRALSGHVEAEATGRPRLAWLAYMILAFGVMCTALTTAYVTATSEARDRGQFSAAVDRIQEVLADRLDADVALLNAGAALFAAQPKATLEDLHRTVTALQPRAHAALLRDLGVSRGLPSADPIRRAAMEQARDTGVPVATGRLNLDEAAVVGFEIYAPIYEGDTPPVTVIGRREAFSGFVHAALPADPLFQGILGEQADQGRVDVEVYASSDRLPEHLLHRSSKDHAGQAGQAPRFTSAPPPIQIAGRPFALSFSTRPGFERGGGRELVPAIMGAGLLASVILFLAVRAQATARALAERRAVGLRTSERALREGERRLRQLEEAEGEARREAEAAGRIRDEVLSTLSHELRTPLTAAMGWVRMLRGGSLNEATAARALEVIERNVKHEAELVEDLLDASVTITGEIRLDMRPIAIEPVVTAAVEAARPAALARSIHLDVSFSAAGQQVKGDRARLRQVLWNLLSNAIRFTPPGGRVHVDVARVGEDVEIAVADSGRGISPSFLPFVFDRFRKAESSVTYASGGLGLGLSLVRYLIEQHGGVVQADSPGEGRGATFTVHLPAILNAPDPPDCGEPKASQRCSEGA